MANNFHLSESELDLEVQKCNKDNRWQKWNELKLNT
jgi:hypothetical protein